jgi:hypothetical protein
MKHAFSLLLVLGCCVLLSACGDDDPAATGNGSVSGTVTFLNSASWPATGDVQVALYSNLTAPDYVPTGAPDAFTNPVTPGVATYNYELGGLDNGTYAGVLVSWRDPANPGGARLLGMHWIYVDSVAIDDATGTAKPPGPTPVAITDAAPAHPGLDILADLGLAP